MAAREAVQRRLPYGAAAPASPE